MYLTCILPLGLVMFQIPQESSSCRNAVNSVKMITTSGMFMMQEFIDSGSDVVDAHDVARRDGQVRDSRRRRSIALPWCAVSDRAEEVFAG